MENQQTLLVIMTVFTGVAAVALLLQMVFLFGIYRSIKVLRERSMVFFDRWEPAADSLLKTLEQLREQSTEILTKVSGLADTTQAQFEKVNSILEDVSHFSETQLTRVDQTIEGALEKVNEATATMQKTLLAPVRQVRAMAAALSAIVESLFGRRQNVDRATHDEEMFI